MHEIYRDQRLATHCAGKWASRVTRLEMMFENSLTYTYVLLGGRPCFLEPTLWQQWLAGNRLCLYAYFVGSCHFMHAMYPEQAIMETDPEALQQGLESRCLLGPKGSQACLFADHHGCFASGSHETPSCQARLVGIRWGALLEDHL